MKNAEQSFWHVTHGAGTRLRKMRPRGRESGFPALRAVWYWLASEEGQEGEEDEQRLEDGHTGEGVAEGADGEEEDCYRGGKGGVVAGVGALPAAE